MNSTVLICLIFLLHQSTALRCRSGNPRISEDLRKIMEKCKHRHSTSYSGKSEEDSSNETSEEDSSEESMFDKDFFMTKKTNESTNTSFKSGSRAFRAASKPFSTNHTRDYRNNSVRDINFNYHRTSEIPEQNKQCNVYCFFNELNLVDERGFPERSAVTRMMVRGIQDPTLRDFVQESILECFRFLAGEMNPDKCTFSIHLLTCFADKGKERCEDWNDQ